VAVIGYFRQSAAKVCDIPAFVISSNFKMATVRQPYLFQQCLLQLEADLQRLSEEHRFLHQSASKREALENDFRTQLRAKVQCLEKEKQVLKGTDMLSEFTFP